MTEPLCRYGVYATSFASEPYGPVIFDYDTLGFAVEEAYRLFDEEGWYSKVVDHDTKEVIYVDYYRIVPKDNSLFETPMTPRERINMDGSPYQD
jgi:hypothetical protein